MFTSFDNKIILKGAAFQPIRNLNIGLQMPNNELDCITVPLAVAHFEWNGFVSLKINNIVVETYSVFHDFGEYGCVIHSLTSELDSITKRYNIKDSKEIELVVSVFCERNVYRVTEKGFHESAKHAFFNYDDAIKSKNENNENLDLSLCSTASEITDIYSSFSDTKETLLQRFAILTEQTIKDNNIVVALEHTSPLDISKLV